MPTARAHQQPFQHEGPAWGLGQVGTPSQAPGNQTPHPTHTDAELAPGVRGKKRGPGGPWKQTKAGGGHGGRLQGWVRPRGRGQNEPSQKRTGHGPSSPPEPLLPADPIHPGPRQPPSLSSPAGRIPTLQKTRLSGMRFNLQPQPVRVREQCCARGPVLHTWTSLSHQPGSRRQPSPQPPTHS